MSVTELETRIVKMQEWEQLAQDAAAEAEAIRDTIKAEMLARDTDELTACLTWPQLAHSGLRFLH